MKNEFITRIYINTRMAGYKGIKGHTFAPFNATLTVDEQHKYVYDPMPLDNIVLRKTNITPEVFKSIMETSKDEFGLVQTSDIMAGQFFYYERGKAKEPVMGYAMLDTARSNVYIILHDPKRDVAICGLYPYHHVRADKNGRNIPDFIASNENSTPIAA